MDCRGSRVARSADAGHESRRIPARSPLDWARKIAFAGVPLQIWWSRRDRIVCDQEHESGLLYRDVKRLNPVAPVSEFVGTWAHTTEMAAHGYLPYALSRFGLLPPRAAPSLQRHSNDPPDRVVLASASLQSTPFSPGIN